MLNKLETRTQKERIEGLFGVWLVYIKNRNKETIDVGKLIINSSEDLFYDSYDNAYKKGSISILGDQNLQIQMISGSRYACLLSNVGASEKLDKMNFIVCSYVSTGAFSPNCGIAILERLTSDNTNIKHGYYPFTDSLFHKIKSNNLFDQLIKYETIVTDPFKNG